MVGTIDRRKKFHALGFALCVSEKTEDFKFIFETIRDSVIKLTGKQSEPKILISDASDAIRNAFKLVFPGVDLQVMCYVHVLRNVTKQKDKYKKEHKNEIFADINTLHLASTPAIFQMLAVLFIKKWSKKDKTFADYFQKEWLGTHCNWYEGAATYTPSTNNSLEGSKIEL